MCHAKRPPKLIRFKLEAEEVFGRRKCNKKLVKETVPLYTKLIIKCNFDSPIWYKNGRLVPVDHKQGKS
ncbi:hypothetical protein ZHAS_00005944 [Anopheles sinensis]|uniref:Uncharacterized protein n=1 Tax=Anopheles sinensis TaxID=74873 RepID=A0A084VKS6_ANOSI|nr:hypothetical protein ZHAS_00005944 [Anopheles sinensis]